MTDIQLSNHQSIVSQLMAKIALVFDVINRTMDHTDDCLKAIRLFLDFVQLTYLAQYTSKNCPQLTLSVSVYLFPPLLTQL